MNLKSFQNRLLDLSRTNNLINYKDRLHTSLSAMAPEPKKIFEALFNDQKLEVFNVDKYVSKFSGETDLTKSDISFEEIIPQIEKYVGDNNILLYKQKGSVFNVLRNILKKSNDALLEKGLNILYISFGMINYEEDGVEYMAPLVLVPIKIEPYARSYKISLYEEECSLNPNFKYKLLNQFKIRLPEISADDDLNLYFDTVNKALKPTGFYVDERTYISLFSFNKINMYQDLLENEGQIKRNSIVKGLLNDGDVLNAKPANLELDSMLVIDCDNTQSEAIDAVRRGESIVLEGPPGTGKSQTITNIISSAIYDGKKVLFVSEKLAALNVVYDKLLKNDLGDFALPLHSTKTNKKEVIKDLYETLFKEKTKTSKSAKLSLLDTKSVEHILDDYAEVLHKKIDLYNLSPYEIFSNYATTKEYESNLMISSNNLNERYISNAVKVLDDYKTYENILEYDYRKTPFYLVSKPKLSGSDIKLLQSCKDELTPLLKSLPDIKRIYNLNLISLDDLRVFYRTYNILLDSKYYFKDFFSKRKIDEYINDTKSLLEDRISLIRSHDIYSKIFKDSILEYDIEEIKESLIKYKGKLFKSLRPGYRKIMKALRAHTINNSKPKYGKAIMGLTSASDYSLFLKSFDSRSASIKKILGKSFDSYNTDFKNLLDMLTSIKYGYTIDGFGYLKLDYSFRLPSITDKSLKSLDNQGLYTIDINTYDVLELFKLINRTIRDYKLIDAYRLFETNVLNKLKGLDAICYLNYSLDNKLALDEIKMPLLHAYYKALVDKVLEEIPALREFNEIVFDKMVNDYINLDHKRFDINKSIIREKIQSLKPNPDAIASGSIASVIKREYLKKRRQMTVREIINVDPDFIKTLKPIFLMSPLSVSSYLTPNVKFDLVIFDEASQVYPEDAIGAIYRGTQVVICGDSKQMPPTSFFHSEIEDSTDEDSASDYESILDMAKSCLKTYRLKWHYRSKCEELIAFSNKYIYNSELTSFPSAMAHRDDFGLELYKVDGVYDKATRSNEIEAQKVIELIDKHYKTYKDTRSIGVVAFSISQQRLIERRLSEYLSTHEVMDNKAEPIFVKNLETVQGDERDTIIFSIGYGYDKDKRFVQNFGPLNREGGERRLNVAISRAKINVKVISSINSYDIKDTNVLGASLLKKYLEFASEPTLKSLGSEEGKSDFSLEVKKFLEDEGYDLDYMVGFSNKKIEICIKDKKTKDYIIAIECDGNTYYESRLCRDRNRLRNEMLTRMGFRYIRVYSTAWYKDNALAKKLLIEQISKDKNNLSLMDVDDFLVSVDNNDITFDEYIYSPDEKLIELYKSQELDFEGLVKRVLDNESPISEAWFIERYKDIFNEGSNPWDEYELLKAMHLNNMEIVSHDGYLMYKNSDIKMRIPYEGGKPRDIKYISPLELAYGMKVLLARNNGLSKDDLYKKMEQTLGYKRMNKQIEAKLDLAIDELKNITILTEKDNKLKVLDI